MKIELKEISIQLSDALGLKEPNRVAVITDGEHALGWRVVSVAEDGSLTQISKDYDSIKEMFDDFGFVKKEDDEPEEDDCEPFAPKNSEPAFVIMRAELDARLEDIEIGDTCYSWEEVNKYKEDYPGLFEGDNLMLKIRISDGKIMNWPDNTTGSFRTIKLVDTGDYEVTDAAGNSLERFTGYVPEVLSIEDKGWGDYLEFDVETDGKIKNWKYDVSKKLSEQ